MDINRIPFLGITQQIPRVVEQSGLAPSQRISELERAQKTLTEKYGPGSIDETYIPVARENFRNGLSAMQFGALGENAINGSLGGKLNLKA